MAKSQRGTNFSSYYIRIIWIYDDDHSLANVKELYLLHFVQVQPGLMRWISWKQLPASTCLNCMRDEELKCQQEQRANMHKRNELLTAKHAQRKVAYLPMCHKSTIALGLTVHVFIDNYQSLSLSLSLSPSLSPTRYEYKNSVCVILYPLIKH